MVDRDNQVVVPFEYDDITEFMDGVAYAIKDGTLYILTKDEGPTVGGFSDVHESDYFAMAVLWAVEKNVTNGVGGGKFDPSGTVTRSQAVTFLWRAAGEPEPTNMTSPFSDVSDQSAWYYKAVLWAAEQGITTGVGGGRFDLNSISCRIVRVSFLCCYAA